MVSDHRQSVKDTIISLSREGRMVELPPGKESKRWVCVEDNAGPPASAYRQIKDREGATIILQQTPRSRAKVQVLPSNQAWVAAEMIR